MRTCFIHPYLLEAQGRHKVVTQSLRQLGDHRGAVGQSLRHFSGSSAHCGEVHSTSSRPKEWESNKERFLFGF